MAKVELKGITKIYKGGIRAVDNVNLVVNHQEFVALVGLSGSGKSTIIKMIAGLEDMSEGDLYIDGELMNDVPPKDRYVAAVFNIKDSLASRNILSSFIPGKFGIYTLYPQKTAEENMASFLKIKKVPTYEINLRVHECARIVNLEKYLSRKLTQLSGGQMLRVAIGRAIAQNPKVFLFDDPFSNLDPKIRPELCRGISDLHKSLGATVIFATDNLAEAESMADRIVMLRDYELNWASSPSKPTILKDYAVQRTSSPSKPAVSVEPAAAPQPREAEHKPYTAAGGSTMTITQKTRGNKKPTRDTQRVFFCCDRRNTADREGIIADLLSQDAGMDCLVSYLETPDNIDRELLQNELEGHQAVVLWVTNDFLTAMAAGSVPVEYRIAKERNVPILPIARDGSLFPWFTQLAGAVHGIARDDAEYRTKLKAQLENFLASEEIIKEIRAKAFTAEIFLSYRKKDIREARSFMKVLHDVKGFEAVSVWYDNNLTAGRIFSDEIEESIKKSDLFTLLVTPSLLEKNAEGKDNYVVATEYPFARKEGKSILPVEAVATDQNRLTAVFAGIPRVVSMNDPAALGAAFKAALGEAAYTAHLDSEHAWLLGMAYLRGVGVEKELERAVSLLASAAEGSDVSALKAAEQLAEIYQKGIQIGIDYDKALLWRKRVAVLSEQIDGEQHPNTAKSYSSIGSVYDSMGEYAEALEWYQKALAIREKVLGKEHPSTAMSYNNIGLVYHRKGDYLQTLEYYGKALAIREKELGKEHPDTAQSYNNIGAMYGSKHDYPKAMEYYGRALAIDEKVLGKGHPSTALIYSNIGAVYHLKGDYPKALEYHGKALAIREKVLGKEHPSTAKSYNNIGVVYHRKDNYSQAMDYYGKALAIREKVLGKEHPSTAESYYFIGIVHKKMENTYTQNTLRNRT